MNQDRAIEYKRLPGKGRRRGGFLAVTRASSALWVGPDHLLCIEGTGYADEYKRFYYREIQGLIARKTARSLVVNILLGGFAALMVLLGFLIGGIGLPIFHSLSGIGLLLLGINLWKGASCVTHLRTAVQLHELPSLNRIKRLRRFMDLILPFIEQAQGRLTPEEIESGLAGLRVESSRPSRVAVRPPPIFVSSSYNGRLHQWLFYGILAFGFASGALSFSKSVLLTGFFSVFSSVLFVLCLIALARQSGAALNHRVKMVAWSVLAYMVALTLFSFILMIVISVQEPEHIQTELDYLRAMAEMTPVDSPFLMGMTIFAAGGGVALGMAGIASMRKRTGTVPASLPPRVPVAEERAE
jgi:hypothetical protein